jgi:hypothetical protein
MKQTKTTRSSRETWFVLTAFLFLGVSPTWGQSGSTADMPDDPLGGKPPVGSSLSVKDLDYQVKYQRAFEVVLWSMPAVSQYGFFRAAYGVGAENNTILAWSKPMTPYGELLTANNITPYTNCCLSFDSKTICQFRSREPLGYSPVLTS